MNHRNIEKRNILIGLMLAGFGTGFFALKSIFIKLAYLEGLNTDSVLMLRMAISLPIYLTIMIWLSLYKPADKSTLKQRAVFIIFLGFIGYFLSSWLDLKGLEYISAQLERLTLFTYPFLIAILGAIFFQTPLTQKIIWSLVVSYLGLWLVFYEELHFTGNATFTGTLLVFGAALSYSFYALFAKKVIHEIGSLWFTAIAMTVSSLFVLAYYAVFFDYSNLVVSKMAWLWVFLLAVFSTVIPSFMIAEAIHRIGPAQTSIIGTLGPVVTILLAIWILHEPFTLNHAIGVILVISGVMILTISKNKKAATT